MRVSQSVRSLILFFVLTLIVALCACDGAGLGAGRDSVQADRAQIPPILHDPYGSPPRDLRIAMPRRGGAEGRASTFVLVSPQRVVLEASQKIALIAITDDRFGVRWSVSPGVRSITPSSSYNQAAVIFTAPMEPGIYTATATRMTNPSQSGSVAIAVTDRADLYIHRSWLEEDLSPDSPCDTYSRGSRRRWEKRCDARVTRHAATAGMAPKASVR